MDIKVIDRTESFLQSFFSDLTTFSFLGFCIWLSQGSKWWTFFTGTMFLMFALGKLSYAFKHRQKSFKTKKELMEWADSLDWGGESR